MTPKSLVDTTAHTQKIVEIFTVDTSWQVFDPLSIWLWSKKFLLRKRKIHIKHCSDKYYIREMIYPLEDFNIILSIIRALHIFKAPSHLLSIHIHLNMSGEKSVLRFDSSLQMSYWIFHLWSHKFQIILVSATSNILWNSKMRADLLSNSVLISSATAPPSTTHSKPHFLFR